MRRLMTPGWLACHAVAAALVAGCLALGWWQFGRAAGGNGLSWAYTAEWPVFAGFVGFIWWREVRRALGHEAPAAATGADPARRPVITARRVAVVDDRDDPELAAYNHYLAWLNANPGARRADYPGRCSSPESAPASASGPPGRQTVEEKTWAQP